MPPKNFRKKGRRRFRRYGRARLKHHAPITNVNRALGPMAPRFVTKLKYCDRITVNLTGGVLNDYVYNLNSLFDPDQSGVGHQPYGRDQLASFYNRYRVFAVGYRVTVLNNIGANNLSTVIVFDNSQTAMTGTTFSLVEEYPRALRGFSTSTAINPRVFHGRIALNRITGVTKEQYRTDDRFQSQFGTTPTENICMHICNFDANGGNGLYIDVELVFHCEMFDPVLLSQS